jgi:hypothetical protein
MAEYIERIIPLLLCCDQRRACATSWPRLSFGGLPHPFSRLRAKAGPAFFQSAITALSMFVNMFSFMLSPSMAVTTVLFGTLTIKAHVFVNTSESRAPFAAARATAFSSLPISSGVIAIPRLDIRVLAWEENVRTPVFFLRMSANDDVCADADRVPAATADNGAAFRT